MTVKELMLSGPPPTHNQDVNRMWRRLEEPPYSKTVTIKQDFRSDGSELVDGPR